MEEWTFRENKDWKQNYSNCNLLNQSPINIDSELVTNCKALCDLKIVYKASKCNVQFKNGLLTIYYDDGSYILYKNIYYKLEKITIHTPSMHTIDHEKYDMEICFFHSAGNNKGGVIISCLYQDGPHYGDAETFFNQFINDIPAFDIDFQEEIEVSKKWSAELLIPGNRSFYVYKGSIPFPPCDEQYYNIVMDNIGHLGTTNFKLLKKYLGSNIRPIQPLNNRQVFYNSGHIIKPSEREININDDRFLRCSKRKNPIKKIVIPNPPKKVDQTSAFKDSTKKYIKSMVTILIILLILLNAYFFTRYLFKYNYAQVFLISMIGPQNIKLENPLNTWKYQCASLKSPIPKQITQPNPNGLKR